MQRLNDKTIGEFTNGAGMRFVLFGCPDGRATFEQANEFALLWADHSGKAAFGHIDAVTQRGAAEAFGVSLMPTTIVFRDGEIVARIEGRASAARLAAFVTHQPAAVAA